MSKKKKLKILPRYKSDKDAEHFVDEADLSDYDLSAFKPMTFEFDAKDKSVHLRISQALLEAVKGRAAKEGLSYQRFMRRALEQAVHGAPRTE